MRRTCVLLLSLLSLSIWGGTAYARGGKRAKSGRLLVESLSIGAQIFVDGVRIGRVPMATPHRLRRGEHTIRLSLAGHADFIDSFVIRRGRTTRMSIELVPVAGILELNSIPDGGEVIIDGLVMGQTPFSSEIESGVHIVEVRSVGYVTHRQRMALDPGDFRAFDIVLERQFREPEPANKPFYQRPWFWAGTGIAVVGVGILATLFASSPSDEKTPGYELEIGTVR